MPAEASKKIDYTKEINIENKINEFKIPSNKNSFEKMNTCIINITENNRKNSKENLSKFGMMRREEDIHDCYLKIDKELLNTLINETYLNASLLLQNIISNYIRENNIENIDSNKEYIYSFNNSYIDILVDISKQMSEEQEVLLSYYT